MTGGLPFLNEYLLGEGKILFFAVAPTLDWSDFPLKGIFVPLIHRSIIYLAAKEHGSPNATTGQDALLVIPPSSGTSGSQYTLTSPDGTQEFVLPVNAMEQGGKFTTPAPTASTNAGEIPPGMLGFLKPHLPLPGYYDLKNGQTLLTVLSANVYGRESDTRKIERADLEESWKRWNIHPTVLPTAEEAAKLQTAVIESRFGVELWKYILAIAVLLALLEMAVARDANRKNAGS